MKDILTYSVLQYKHSLALGEIINVGVLFYSSKYTKFKLILTDESRIKAIYPDFNAKLYKAYSKIIEYKVNEHITIFSGVPTSSDFAGYIHKNIHSVDAAGLVFGVPVTVPNPFDTFDEAVNEFARILLPGIQICKPEHTIRHDDHYIIQKFKTLIPKDIESKIQQDVVFKASHISLKFNYAYTRQSFTSYIRPVSFDLSDEVAIQQKAAMYYGYLSDLTRTSERNSFDLLISKPQNSTLIKSFENSIDYLDSVSKRNKNLIVIDDERIADYSRSLFD